MLIFLDVTFFFSSTLTPYWALHLHQTRHTYARMVAEHAGSLLEVQEALGHRDIGNTRVYVQRITMKKDRYSRQIAQRLKLRLETTHDNGK